MGKRYLNKRKNFEQAFTIVELIIVVLVIGILVSLSVVVYNGVRQKASDSALLSDLDNAVSILEHDLSANGTYPTTLDLADGGKGVSKSSSDTQYQYTVDNSATPPIYCLSGTVGKSSFYVSSSNTNPLSGLCQATNIIITVPALISINTAYASYVNIDSSATGTPAPTAQWQKLPKNVNSGTWTDIVGQTSPNLSYAFLYDYVGGDYAYFRVLYTNTSGTEISQPIKVEFFYSGD